MNENTEPGSPKPILVLLVNSCLMALAWKLTYRWGPWWCHGIAEPLSLLIVLRWGGEQQRNPIAQWGFGAISLGAVLALLSWYVAPLAIHWMPPLGHDLHRLYATLRKAPGPARALPILALTVLNEEIVWRGVAIDWCKRRFSTPRTVVFATLTYVLPIIASGSLLLVTVAAILGGLLSVERVLYRTWFAPFVTHLTWSLLVFVVHPLT